MRATQHPRSCQKVLALQRRATLSIVNPKYDVVILAASRQSGGCCGVCEGLLIADLWEPALHGTASWYKFNVAVRTGTPELRSVVVV